MKKLITLLAGICFLLPAASVVHAQRAIIAGEQAAGVYVNIKTDASGNLFVTDAPTVTSMTNTAKTVTSASGVLVAANTSRRYFSVQNNDASGTIYCTPTATATAANGVKIIAGQMWAPSVAPTNAINCIGSIASNANVILTEGQ